MQQNNNTETPQGTLSEATNTRAGTAEQGALKTIHRNYNKLNGYEAMLHIINKYRFVLYPFIILSVLGSAYSFYMDYTKVFPFMPEWLKIIKALFFSIMLEIVRDGSIIALFNSKMKLPSRVLVIIIFFGVTTYLFNTHIKTKNIIEQSAIEYALLHQDEKAVSAKNPKYETATQELDELKEDLTRKKLEITDTLIANTTSIYVKKRTDAKVTKQEIEDKIEQIKAEIKAKRAEINGYKQDNITSIEESQKLISSVLLTTLILIESLAMLGAVIKFINKDNADKEVAKHSEIIEQYEDMSEQMRKTNDDLGLMLSRDIESSGKQNLAFVSAMADNREMFQSQMNEILKMFAQTQTFNFNQPHFNQALHAQSVPIQPTQQAAQHQEPQQEEYKPMKRIGFAVNNRDDLINKIFKDVEGKGEKLPSKTSLVDIHKRSETKIYENTMRELRDIGIVDYQRGKGYFLAVGKESAMQTLHESETPFRES